MSSPSASPPPLPALQATVKTRGDGLMTQVQQRLAQATLIASRFDAVTSELRSAPDECISALLERIQTEVLYFMDNDFSTTPVPTNRQVPAKPVTTPVNSPSPLQHAPAVSNARETSRSPTPSKTPFPTYPRSFAAVAAAATPRSGLSASVHTATSAPEWQTVTHRPRQLPRPANPRDPRIMVRLAPDSLFRLRPASQCLAIARKALGPYASSLQSIQMVPSGLALLPSSPSARSCLLDSTDALRNAFNASSVDEQTGRDAYVLLFAPRAYVCPALGSHNGTSKTSSLTELTAEAYATELTAILGVAPAHVHITDNHQLDTCTLFVSFAKGSNIPKRPFTIFGARLRFVKSRASGARKLHQCERCFGFHITRGCSRPPACDFCGVHTHLTSQHPLTSATGADNIPCCVNCQGPHKASSPDCPLRPISDRRGLSRPESAAIRAAQRSARLAAVAEWDEIAARRQQPDQMDIEILNAPSGDPEPDVSSSDFAHLLPPQATLALSAPSSDDDL